MYLAVAQYFDIFLGTGTCSLAHFDESGIPKALAAMVETLKEHAQNHGEHRYKI
jgi:hypothetical protein